MSQSPAAFSSGPGLGLRQSPPAFSKTTLPVRSRGGWSSNLRTKSKPTPRVCPGPNHIAEAEHARGYAEHRAVRRDRSLARELTRAIGRHRLHGRVIFAASGNIQQPRSLGDAHGLGDLLREERAREKVAAGGYFTDSHLVRSR